MPLPPAVKLDLKFEQLLPLVLDPLSQPLHRAASSLRNMAAGQEEGYAVMRHSPNHPNLRTEHRLRGSRNMRVEGCG